MKIIQNSQIHIQIFHKIARLSSIDFPDHEESFRKMGCAWRYLEAVSPRRFCILLTCQLNTCLRVQGITPKVYCLGNGFPRTLFPSSSTRSQPQDCRSLLNLLLLGATGFSAAFPLSRQSMHPSVALEKSTLRQVSWDQYSSCCRVSPKLLASPYLQMQSDSMRWKNSLLMKKDLPLHVATWTQLSAH